MIFGTILNFIDVFAPVTLQQMDIGTSFKPMDVTASARSTENGERFRIPHDVNSISHVCWSGVKLTTKFKFKFIADADTSTRVHVMDETDHYKAFENSSIWNETPHPPGDNEFNWVNSE